MRLNNKGFAITAVLYGLLILFAILVSSYLLVLSAKKDRIDVLVDEIENEYRSEAKTINLKDYIMVLYNDAIKEEIYHRGIKYIRAPSVNLMKDRFGGDGSDDSGNIRYYGPSHKVNNYIYFNCETYPSTKCELWRIIGIVDGKVKIIRNKSIGDLAWDQDKNQNESLTTYNNNNWQTSSLQEFLNGLYYNRGTIESHTYYSGNDGNTTTMLDLKTIGITEATRTNNLISETPWYLGGYKTSVDVFPNDIYNYERTKIYSGDSLTMNAKIGLIYASDYGYAVDLELCKQDLYNYSLNGIVEDCKDNNWLIGNQWLITSGNKAWLMSSNGAVAALIDVFFASGVRPSLYLDSKLVIKEGNEGTSTDPYRIIVS